MKFTLLLFFSLSIIYHVNAQAKLTTTDKLYRTAKVWGFLKYYHPQVAKGEFDWDQELFTIVDSLPTVNTKEELSDLYIRWIDRLGKMKKRKAKTNKKAEYFDKNFDLSWTRNKDLFTTELSEKLTYIEHHRYQGKGHYVDYYSKLLEIADFKNESQHFQKVYDDEKLRMLTLFRFWNQVEYFFPYKYQIDVSWDLKLYELIPKFTETTDEEAFHFLLLEMVVGLDDSHAMMMTEVISKSIGQRFLPVYSKFHDGELIVVKSYNDSLAKANNLRPGDIITHVNGVPTDSIYQNSKKYLWGSNEARKGANSHLFLRSNIDSTILRIKRNNEIIDQVSKTYHWMELEYEPAEKAVYKILDNNIGYINMGILEHDTVEYVMDSLAGTKGLIIDVRNYPRGTMYDLANYFTHPTKKFATFTYPDLSYPGKFKWDKPYWCGNNQELRFKNPVILLVNDDAQSHAEFSIMALQTGNDVTTIGSQTSGADGNVIRLTLVGEHDTRFTGLGVFYPDRSETQRVGVRIDEIVYPTTQGIAAGRDELMERAIEIIKEKSDL